MQLNLLKFAETELKGLRGSLQMTEYTEWATKNRPPTCVIMSSKSNVHLK